MRIVSQSVLAMFITVAGAATVGAQPRECSAKHQPFVQGGVAQGEMRLVNNGKACTFTFKFGGNFEPDTWKVEEPPKHGRIAIEGSTIGYVPESNYAGADAFTVAVFGYNPMIPRHHARDGRFRFDVVVRAAP